MRTIISCNIIKEDDNGMKPLIVSRVYDHELLKFIIIKDHPTPNLTQDLSSGVVKIEDIIDDFYFAEFIPDIEIIELYDDIKSLTLMNMSHIDSDAFIIIESYVKGLRREEILKNILD